MPLRIKILCDNVIFRGEGLLGEHGLSVYIEREGRGILFDTGQGLTIRRNARLLGVNLEEIEGVVLSHGHYDHTGGLREVLRKGMRVIAHPGIFSPKYALRNGKTRYIGIPFSRDAIEGWAGELTLTSEPVEVLPGVFTTGTVPRVTPFEEPQEDLILKEGKGFVKDPVEDDLSLFASTPDGIVVILGCAHRGVINILTHIRELTGKGTFLAILGGTHLGFYPEERRRKVVEALKAFDIKRMAVSHCTGTEGVFLLRERLPAEVLYAPVGFTAEF